MGVGILGWKFVFVEISCKIGKIAENSDFFNNENFKFFI